METEFKTTADKVIKNKRLQNRKKILIFSFCLFISLFFWMLKKFSNDYQLVVPFKVSLQNLPSDKVLLNNMDTTLFITIKSQGFNLIYFQLFYKSETKNIDISQIQLTEGKDQNTSYIGASQLIKLFKRQAEFNYNIVSIFPDTFALYWEKAYFKNVAVKPLLNLNFQKQYQLYDSLILTPDTICISGTYEDLKQINTLYTKPQTLNNLNSNQFIYLNIKKPVLKNRIKYFADKVKVFVPVEKFTEAEIEVPINIQNNLEKYDIKIFPDKVKVKYLVALKDFKKVTPEMFVAAAKIQSINKSDNKAKIDIVNYPPNIRITKIYPEKLEYIIFK